MVGFERAGMESGGEGRGGRGRREGDLGVRGVAEEVEEVGGLQNAGRDLFGGESLERGAALRVGRHSCHPQTRERTLTADDDDDVSASAPVESSRVVGPRALHSLFPLFFFFTLFLFSSLSLSDSRSGGVLWFLSFIRFATVAA